MLTGNGGIDSLILKRYGEKQNEEALYKYIPITIYLYSAIDICDLCKLPCLCHI